MSPTRVHVIDSHTGGEPTRVVLEGGPALGSGPLAERARRFASEFDGFRSAVVNEPRGFDAIVGALLCEPVDPSCAAGVIFFNNVGTIGMCGHGSIGLVATLAHLGKIAPGEHRIETTVGTVTATLHESGEVGIRNVASFRSASNVPVDVPGHGTVHGDIAWGGNWFFLCDAARIPDLPEFELRNVSALTTFTLALRASLESSGITGDGGAEIDHIELFGPPSSDAADSRNFVLCPGGAYDRSPCGTGTSAKVACLIEDGKLGPGDWWRQESITRSVFQARAVQEGDALIPEIRGRAHVIAETTLIFQDDDPLREGIRP